VVLTWTKQPALIAGMAMVHGAEMFGLPARKLKPAHVVAGIGDDAAPVWTTSRSSINMQLPATQNAR